MATHTPFHSGELAAQQRAGSSSIARRNGAIVASRIMDGARPFLQKQPMVLLGSRDESGAMWASLVFGRPGFLASQDGTLLDIDLNQALVDDHDVIWNNVTHDGRLGSLVIDLTTRQRIRINGSARLDAANHLWIAVEESYPACPKYITRRHVRVSGAASSPAAENTSGTVLTSETRQTLAAADTLFIATQSPEGGYDISHRGGTPGFVKVTGPNTVRWPEYPGNGMLNTVGNLVHDSHAGLVVPDFANQRMLQLTGTAVTLWDQPDVADESGGTDRFIEFTVDRWQQLPLPGNVKNEWLDYSPFNPQVVAAGDL